jgi:transposase InsO family protein
MVLRIVLLGTYARMLRVPSPVSKSRADAPLDLFHSDVCGPFQIPSISGKRYMLTILDDYSKFAFVRFVSKKSDVTEELQDVIVMCEQQLGRSVRKLRSDGGGEYICQTLQRFLRDKGILH